MKFKTPRNDLQDTLQLLHTVLANWDMLADVPNNLQQKVHSYDFDGCRVVLRRGLCHLFGLLQSVDRGTMFECWEDFSGTYSYPVGTREEYDYEYRFNKFANPKRKDLLIHCISLIEEYLNEPADD